MTRVFEKVQKIEEKTGAKEYYTMDIFSNMVIFHVRNIKNPRIKLVHLVHIE